MEPKARFVLVGFFVSLFSLIGVAIVLWIVGVGPGSKQYDIYVVKTDNSVGGLNKDADVRYKGVKVGKVISINIDKKNPEYIEIYIAVEKDLPVKTDTKAKISSNGLTGISYINLIGGSKDKPLLKAKPGKRYPVIQTVPTTLEQLSVLASKVMRNTNILLLKLNGLFDEKMIGNIHNTVANINMTSKEIEKIAKNLKVSEEKLNTLLTNTNDVALRIKSNSKHFDSLIGKLEELTQDTDNLLKANSKNIKTFTSAGLENLNATFTNLKSTSSQLKDLIIELKQNPSLVIRGVKIRKGPGE